MHLSGPRPITGPGPVAPTAVKSPLSYDNANDILGAAGMGPHQRVSKQQFSPQSPMQGGGEAAEGAEAGGEAAAGAGAGEAVDLLALAAL